VRISIASAVLFVLLYIPVTANADDSAWEQAFRDPAAAHLPRPSAVQYAWHEQERIAFLCLDPCTWQGREYDNHSTPLKQINPTKLDANQWCEAAKSWGAKEILLVCKHCGGFCWWPTETTDYCVKNIAWKNGKGNMVQDVVDACRRHSLKLGIYIYSDDPKYTANIGRGGRTDDPKKPAEWNAKLRRQWEEVLTMCGPDLVQEIWFDGSCVVPLDDVIKKLAPRATVLQGPLTDLRWVGNEAGCARDPNWNTLRSSDLKSGVATEAHSTPDGDAWAPVECDTTLYNHYWFWSERAEKETCNSLDKLMNIYLRSVGHGAVLLLNSTPNTTGLIPNRDMALYRQFGETLQREFGHPLATVGRRAGSSVEVDLGGPRATNAVDLWEEYRYGQRIRQYSVEAHVEGRWRAVVEGTAVGRRKIDVFPEVRADRLRLTVHRSVGTPMLRQIMVHRVGAGLAAMGGRGLSVARQARATASSVHSAPYEARFINDGDSSTRWGAKDDDSLSWVEYDLGRRRRFAATAIQELANRVQAFVIETRNATDAPWQTVYTGSAIGVDFKTPLPATTARYVRLRITKLKELSATIWEWDLFDDANAWELVAERPLAVVGGTLDVDLSVQVTEPGQYEVRIEGAKVTAARPLFEAAPGEARFVERIDASTYRLNRTQAVGEGCSTGVRLTIPTPQAGTMKVLVRPQ
jgi:alpha-L-fucosidase